MPAPGSPKRAVSLNGITRGAVLKAIDDYDALGQTEFHSEPNPDGSQRRSYAGYMIDGDCPCPVCGNPGALTGQPGCRRSAPGWSRRLG